MPKTSRHQTALFLEHLDAIGQMLKTDSEPAIRDAEKGVEVDAGDGVDLEIMLS